MAVYRYPLPRRYRRVRYSYRYPVRYRSRGNSGSALPAVVIAGAVLLAGAGAKVAHHAHKAPAFPSAGNPAAPAVVAFARARVGKVPYAWGGTTDAGMDCSGLTQAAYGSAGIPIERTSQQQWASEQHVPASQVVPGDLVFFAGSDGTPSAPGHVGIVTGKNTMIDEYGAGTYARYDTFGPAAAPGTGLSAVVGFTNPAPASPGPGAAAGEAGNVTLGRRLAASYGWPSGGQWSCLYDLWERESGWQNDIANPQSGAFGIAQALGHGGSGTSAVDAAVRHPDGSAVTGVTVNEYPSRAANSGDARAQIEWGLSYIRGTYGTPCEAWAHEGANSWY